MHFSEMLCHATAGCSLLWPQGLIESPLVPLLPIPSLKSLLCWAALPAFSKCSNAQPRL